jgi:hypothetical protein
MAMTLTKRLGQMAREQAENREKVLTAFRDFVTILDTTQTKRQIFRFNEKLRTCAVDLYEAVLGAITKLVDRLNHRSWRKLRSQRSHPHGQNDILNH